MSNEDQCYQEFSYQIYFLFTQIEMDMAQNTQLGKMKRTENNLK